MTSTPVSQLKKHIIVKIVRKFFRSSYNKLLHNITSAASNYNYVGVTGRKLTL